MNQSVDERLSCQKSIQVKLVSVTPGKNCSHGRVCQVCIHIVTIQVDINRPPGTYRSCNSSLFDLFMFKSTWKPIITAIAFAFITFDDDYTVQRAITGFRQLATLAGHFQLPEVFDYVVVSLSQVTSLIPDTLMTRVPHYPVVKVEGQGVTVSPLSIRFGTNFKGQLAAVVLFTIINGNGNAIREGWTQVTSNVVEIKYQLKHCSDF